MPTYVNCAYYNIGSDVEHISVHCYHHCLFVWAVICVALCTVAVAACTAVTLCMPYYHMVLSMLHCSLFYCYVTDSLLVFKLCLASFTMVGGRISGKEIS